MIRQNRKAEKKRLYELIAQSYTSNRSKWEVELFEDFMLQKEIPKLVDDLLDGGVIVPPCKVGDTVWFIYRDSKWQGIIDSGVVENLSIRFYDGIFNGMGDVGINTKKQPNEGDNYYHVFFNNVFKSKKAAEQALKERENNV